MRCATGDVGGRALPLENWRPASGRERGDVSFSAPLPTTGAAPLCYVKSSLGWGLTKSADCKTSAKAQFTTLLRCTCEKYIQLASSINGPIVAFRLLTVDICLRRPLCNLDRASKLIPHQAAVSHLNPQYSILVPSRTIMSNAEPNNAALYDARRRQTGSGSQVLDNIVSGSNCTSCVLISMCSRNGARTPTGHVLICNPLQSTETKSTACANAS